jgi:N-acetylglucosaminyl-diphospho-decaprenol L-rhamnosyltransferase
MSSGSPWARVIIVNHNAGPLLQRCVAALAAQTFPGFEAVIVDNASKDGSVEALHLPDGRFRIERAGTNLGFAAANNLGAAGCGTDWIATLNPDAEPGEAWLDELRRATLRHGSAKMFGSTQINARRRDRVDGFGDVVSIYGTAWRGASGWPVTTLPEDDREVFAPCAAAALYARDAFLAAGGFDESFFCYLEDVDLGFRLRLRGERCIQVRRAEVLHLGAAIAGEDSEFSVFHRQRNRLWLIAKCVPSPLLWLMLSLQALVVPLTVLRRGAGRWDTALSGVGAGLRGLPGAWRQRRGIQAARTLSNLELARMMVWDPNQALRHAPLFLRADADVGPGERV